MATSPPSTRATTNMDGQVPKRSLKCDSLPAGLKKYTFFVSNKKAKKLDGLRVTTELCAPAQACYLFCMHQRCFEAAQRVCMYPEHMHITYRIQFL